MLIYLFLLEFFKRFLYDILLGSIRFFLVLVLVLVIFPDKQVIWAMPSIFCMLKNFLLTWETIGWGKHI